MKTTRRASGLTLITCLLGGLLLSALPAASAPRAAGGAAETPSGPFLIQGDVKAVEGATVTVKTADHGPGLTHGPGIRSRLVILGKSFAADTAHARFQAVDGTAVTAPMLKTGDHVVMLVQSKTGDSTSNIRAIPVTASLIIVNEARP